MPDVARELEDLRRSRAVHAVGSELGGFRKFLLRGNVVDLAVGIVVGAAFGNVVQALVRDVITPLLSIFGGAPNAGAVGFTVHGHLFPIGDLITAAISFLLIAAIVYFLVVVPVNKLMDRYRSAPQPAPTKDCPECLSTIPQEARRCRECGAQLAPPSDEVAAAMRQLAAPSGEAVADQAAQVLAQRLTGQT